MHDEIQRIKTLMETIFERNLALKLRGSEKCLVNGLLVLDGGIPIRIRWIITPRLVLMGLDGIGFSCCVVDINARLLHLEVHTHETLGELYL
jgi:hypothetical protein